MADRDESKVEAGKEEEVEEVTALNRPRCPQCGYHNTRLSHNRGMLDSMLRRFSLRAFRCRSCGSRFRATRRAPKV
jgi:DNA-directed RNA polymerase subunit RPC12/RpoP